MPLTPEDVRNKRFTPVRLREGYDMGEVDQFLDEVEAELERLTVENDELRAKVAAASTGEPTGLIPAQETAPQPAVQTQPEPPPMPEPEPIRAVEPEPSIPALSSVPTGPAAASTTMGDASVAAARLLEIASANADQLMEQAKEEADRIVGEARAKAERITNESRGKADRLETDARIRAQKLDDETNERRQQAVATIERERYELQREVEHLRAYEREYRARLKNYFQSQLDQLAANESTNSTSAVQAPADDSPRRLRSLLGDEDTGSI
jgi:DivIVA domain-containing protein